jgi:hypothetical protein
MLARHVNFFSNEINTGTLIEVTMRKNILMLISVLGIFFIGLQSNVLAHGGVKHKKKESVSITYSEHVRPLFEEKCSSCHGEESPDHHEFERNMKKYILKDIGPRMDSYTYLVSFIVWPGTGTLMRRLDDGKGSGSGKPGNMYQYLGNSEEERQKNLNLFKSWIGNWSLANWEWMSKEDIDSMLLQY